MNLNSEQLGVQLGRNAMFTMDDAADVRFSCRAGTLWITLDGDGRDIVLEPGDSFSSPEHRRALVWALRPSCVDVTAAS